MNKINIEAGSYQHRYGGIARLYGKEQLHKFRHSHICIVGIGGVGSWAVEALARSGIGQLTLIDWDDICYTNTNRQIHTGEGTVGKAKVEIMAEPCKFINPDLKVNSIREFITEKNIQELISRDFDYVFDAIDKASIKCHIIAHCKHSKVPVITAGGTGGRIDPTKIEICDLRKAYKDPLLSRVRKTLRQKFNFTRNLKRNMSVPCIYSPEEMRYPDGEGKICMQKTKTGEKLQLDCSQGLGSISMVTATMGFAACSKMLTDIANNNSASKDLPE